MWDAFSSASLIGAEAKGFMGAEQGTFFTIEGVSAPMVNFVSWFPGQAEALYRRGTNFVVRSRVSNTLLSMLESNAELIKMSEVSPSSSSSSSNREEEGSFFTVRKLSDDEKIHALLTHAKDTQFLYKGFIANYVDGVLNSVPNSRTGSFSVSSFIGRLLSVGANEKIRAVLVANGGAGKSSSRF